MDSSGEYDLAWDLVALASSVLTAAQRCLICASIGAGQPEDAIRSILETAEHLEALPAELMTRMTSWLDCYIGSDREPGLRTLMARFLPPT